MKHGGSEVRVSSCTEFNDGQILIETETHSYPEVMVMFKVGPGETAS